MPRPPTKSNAERRSGPQCAARPPRTSWPSWISQRPPAQGARPTQPGCPRREERRRSTRRRAFRHRGPSLKRLRSHPLPRYARSGLMYQHWIDEGVLRKRMSAPLACLVVGASSVVAVASPAAATCGTRSGAAVGGDAAWVLNVGTCSHVQVRHRRDPVGSSNNYYTNWHGGSAQGTAYYTPSHPVYMFYETGAW